ncbi:ACT domain-containing protein [Nocardioides dongxiaopingii]|uniref:ACT domain-containing protein n=1 Tax=Nocardioides dongxiaopingii TaxID=2576036 RepID=UPI0010C76E81|nr:ACT domain-containing protein [Nocardioides dongxiaopingii]
MSTDNPTDTPNDTPNDSTGDGTGGGLLTIEQFPEKIAVLKLAAGADIPEWAESSSIFSITATAAATTVVCAGRSVPKKVPGVRGLIGFQAAGAAGAADTAGLLVGLLEPLAEESIAVQVLTAYDHVWVLVSADAAERAGEAWRRRGHTVALATPA